jgi:Protein of unknown function (DUF4058)
MAREGKERRHHRHRGEEVESGCEEQKMPMHDWRNVEAGIYHDFHHEWISEIKRYLNTGVMPDDMYAMAEQITRPYGPDVLALQRRDDQHVQNDPIDGGTATLVRPKPIIRQQAKRPDPLARPRSRVVIRHVSGDRIICIIEIISPGNKSSTNEYRALVDKAVNILNSRINLVLLDPFPPLMREQEGLHPAVWTHFSDDAETNPPNRPLTFASYESEEDLEAFVEPLAVGEALPDIPVFLSEGVHVMLPLESLYQRAWAEVPRRWQEVIAPA